MNWAELELELAKKKEQAESLMLIQELHTPEEGPHPYSFLTNEAQLLGNRKVSDE